MPIRGRKSKLFGSKWFGVRLNASNSGLSRSWVVGPWSWNSRTRKHRVDLPGPFHWIQKGRKRQPRQARRVAEPYEQQRRAELRAQPRNLLPAANLLGTLGSLGTVSFLLGAPLWAGIGGLLASLGGTALGVWHVRRQRAIGRRGLPFLPYPNERRASSEWANFQQAPDRSATHPGCRAKSAATCRCPGRRRAPTSQLLGVNGQQAAQIRKAVRKRKGKRP